MWKAPPHMILPHQCQPCYKWWKSASWDSGRAQRNGSIQLLPFSFKVCFVLLGGCLWLTPEVKHTETCRELLNLCTIMLFTMRSDSMQMDFRGWCMHLAICFLERWGVSAWSLQHITPCWHGQCYLRKLWWHGRNSCKKDITKEAEELCGEGVHKNLKDMMF